MPTKVLTTISFLSAILLLGLLVSCNDTPANVTTTKVVQCEGLVGIKGPDGSSTKAKVGSILLPDSMIRTGADAKAKVQIGDRAVISIEPNSSVKVRDLFKDGTTGQENTRIEFQAGKSMLNITKKLAAQDSFDVMTPSAVAGVRGTEFLVDTEDAEQSKIAVVSGSVVVRKRIAALDDAPKNSTQPAAIKEALKELAQSQEIPVTSNQELAVEKKDTEKVNAIVSKAVAEASEKMNSAVKDTSLDSETKKSVLKEAVASVIQESTKQISESIAKNEMSAPTAAKPQSAETKQSVKQIEVIAPVAIEELKSLKVSTKPEAPKAEEATKKEPVEVAPEKIKQEAPVTPKPVIKAETPAPIKATPTPVKTTPPVVVSKPAQPTTPVVEKVLEGKLTIDLSTEGASLTLVGGGKEYSVKVGDNTLPQGTYTLRSELKGYKPYQSTVTIQDGKATPIKVALAKRVVVSSKIILLDGTVILGKIIKQNDNEVTIETDNGTQTLSLKKIDEIQPVK